MMIIGITGANGFIGWHLRCFLKTLSGDEVEVKLANRQTFGNQDDLNNFVSQTDFIVHLAGTNRASDDELLSGNIEPAKQLISALRNCNIKPTLLYASTTHAINPRTIYGRAKKSVTDLFTSWAQDANANFINLIIPHVYGEYCTPFYNSGVATFCHQITHDITPDINPDGELELIHIQELSELIIDLFTSGHSGDYRVDGHKIGVPDVVEKLFQFNEQYLINKQLPNLNNKFDRDLFNTFRSYVGYRDIQQFAELHSDHRGWLTETVKAHSGGQCFVSSTLPGVTRGNHYHRRKVERFFVLKGYSEVKLRKIFSDEIITYNLDGENPSYIDIPTLHTHSITNVGTDELITLFWADEFYDPNSPDTYFEAVQ